MIIRPLVSTEMDEWIAIVKQLSPQSSLGTLSQRSAWVDLTQLQNKAILVAEQDGKLVGTTSILIEDKINRGTNPATGNLYTVAHVEEVVVDEAYRGTGVGKALMAEAVKWAKIAGAYKIILDCAEHNVQFYENCGFERYEVCMRMSL